MDRDGKQQGPWGSWASILWGRWCWPMSRSWSGLDPGRGHIYVPCFNLHSFQAAQSTWTQTLCLINLCSRLFLGPALPLRLRQQERWLWVFCFGGTLPFQTHVWWRHRVIFSDLFPRQNLRCPNVTEQHVTGLQCFEWFADWGCESVSGLLKISRASWTESRLDM